MPVNTPEEGEAIEFDCPQCSERLRIVEYALPLISGPCPFCSADIEWSADNPVARLQETDASAPPVRESAPLRVSLPGDSRAPRNAWAKRWGLLLGLLVLIALGLGGWHLAFGASTVLPSKSSFAESQHESIESESEPAVASAVAGAPSPCRSVLMSVLSAQTWPERLPFLVNTDSIDGREVNWAELPGIEEFHEDSNLESAIPSCKLLVARADSKAAPVIARFVKNSSGALKLDWHLFAQSATDSFRQFCAAPGQQAGMFILNVRKLENRFGRAACFALCEPGSSDVRLRVSLDKKSAEAKRLDELVKPGAIQSMAVVLGWNRYPEHVTLIDCEPVSQALRTQEAL